LLKKGAMRRGPADGNLVLKKKQPKSQTIHVLEAEKRQNDGDPQRGHKKMSRCSAARVEEKNHDEAAV